ncbi:hypothetical protein ACWEOZ_44010 [Actinoplanes sp. NPDC004185]
MDLLAPSAVVDRGRRVRPGAPDTPGTVERSEPDRLVTCGDGRQSHRREEGGAGTGPSPVNRAKPGSEHHLICDGNGTPIYVLTSGANVPATLLADKAYSSAAFRPACRERGTEPIIPSPPDLLAPIGQVSGLEIVLGALSHLTRNHRNRRGAYARPTTKPGLPTKIPYKAHSAEARPKTARGSPTKTGNHQRATNSRAGQKTMQGWGPG